MVPSRVLVIYNPNSTGPSRDLAEKLKADLEKADFSTPIELVATERAGHAVELAYQAAKDHERPLIVSSSGDGGYNEVVNGAMQAQAEGANPMCAVLAAGNANDHSRTVMKRPLHEAMLEGNEARLDVLVASVDGRKIYAHSYIGIGLTPTVAVRLNEENLNRFKETVIVYKALRDLQPVEIRVNGRTRKVDSLVIANIGNMAKVLRIADNARPDDGKIRVTTFPYRHRARLIRMLLKAIFQGITGKTRTYFEFETLKKTVLQFDGEVHEIEAGQKVGIRADKGALHTFL